ncbi:hypothetical protein LTR37_009826 [Vermiconidia calcicola]|uniref:Uncharacterized protein n=1 Tax=Vermiconidia calcicola TaxID=1690605 RepID=A0ACC3N8G2_9PEZI|nr:hypothetical protein LTR37_009826 [Vermiconidia calcicola]
MATSANLPPGATPAHDPFTSNSSYHGNNSGGMRFAPFDTDSLYTTSSPSQAKRALEAHLKDTDRRIQDASRLGTTLVQQRKDLAARLKDVEQVSSQQDGSQVPQELRKKLADLEREYNEIGKESARAFLPKTRTTSMGGDVMSTPSAYAGSGRESPTKLTAPSRRQRNQPTNRVHDIEFATEISTSLLAQVRQLQSALLEKDEELKDTTGLRAQLEAEAAGMVQRIRQLDESEQRYKDENWNLEMRLQDLEASFKDSTDKESRLAQNLKTTQSDKAAAQRDLDDLKVSHEKLNEEHAVIKRQQETDIHVLRRDAASHETEKSRMQKKIEELTSQNTELAKAVSYRWNQPSTATDTDFVSADEDHNTSDNTPPHSEPASPVKGTPRHGHLESETLKSSLNHAHRMIQNLKNNIHREKTEKIELKRMLQDARDELEARRSESNAGTGGLTKKRSTGQDSRFRKPARPLNRGSGATTTEILEDDMDWEDDGTRTPSKSRSVSSALGGAFAGAAGTAAFDHASFGGEDTESTDAAFETATERGEGTSTEDAFETATEREHIGADDSDELTETEASGVTRAGTVRKAPSGLEGAKKGDRRSFMSTASTSADEEEDDVGVVRTPVREQGQPKYRLRGLNYNRPASGSGSGRRGRVSEVALGESRRSGSPYSPASSQGTPSQPPGGQSLGDELDALSDDVSTPGTSRFGDSTAATPDTQRRLESLEPETPGSPTENVEEPTLDDMEPDIGSPLQSVDSPPPKGEEGFLAHQANAAMLAHEAVINKPTYADAGVMTEPWVPEVMVPEQKGLRERAGEIVGGALAGFGLGRISSGDTEDEADAGADADKARAVEPAQDQQQQRPSDVDERRLTVIEPTENAQSQQLGQSDIVSLETEPTKDVQAQQLGRSDIASLDTEPVAPEPESSTLQRITNSAAEPAVPLAAAAPLAVQAEEKQKLDFSSIATQDLEPVELPLDFGVPATPLLPKRSSKRIDAVHVSEGTSPDENDRELNASGIPGTDRARIGAGFFGGAPVPQIFGGGQQRAQQYLSPRDRALDGSADTDQSSFLGPPTSDSMLGPPTSDSTLTMHGPPTAESIIPMPQPLQVKKAMADEGSQTLVSGDDIDSMMRAKSVVPSGLAAGAGAVAGAAAATAIAPSQASSPSRPPTAVRPDGPRRSIDGPFASDASAALRAVRRPASSGSMRNKVAIPTPPLPEDKAQKIAAAQKTPGPATSGPATAGTMGPPLMPASAYKQNRPTTPANDRKLSREGTTPRARGSMNHMNSPGGASGISRRTSVSSFASEIDERFNMQRGHLMYPEGVQPATDPRMIQAITQTMIGEYLWKYTRKAGRNEMSTTRHRRFFWVHPYTRTLYWSEKDPSTAGRDMLKAKSVAIEAVRVITDDNSYPPGLHRKTLIVVTPGREIVFTAPTSQRHETWFNALSYLILRTEQERGEVDDHINQEDIDEFNPGFGSSIRKSIRSLTGRSQSRTSLSSYHSRTTRTSSPQRDRERERARAGATLAQRQSAAATRAKGTPTPEPVATMATASASSRRYSSMRDSNSGGGRFSSLTSKFRSGGQRGSFSSSRGRASGGRAGGSEIYDASVAAESAEDLRAVIEKQEQDADRLENVRACCDGKHDVGSLSHKGRHSSFGSRNGHSHAHTHGHAHPPRAQPTVQSQRPRRGE